MAIKCQKMPFTEMTTKPTHAKPSLYAYYFLELKEIALKYGYNLVLHGSLNRDLDLIGIPWTDEPGKELDMIKEFCTYLGGRIQRMDAGKDYSILPGGRHSYVINIVRTEKNVLRCDAGGCLKPGEEWRDEEYYVDISLTPRPKKQRKKKGIIT